MVSEPLGRRLSDGSTFSARSKYLTSSYEGKTVWSSLLPSPGLSDKLFTRVDETKGSWSLCIAFSGKISSKFE
jgi:hypothetical protein